MSVTTVSEPDPITGHITHLTTDEDGSEVSIKKDALGNTITTTTTAMNEEIGFIEIKMVDSNHNTLFEYEIEGSYNHTVHFKPDGIKLDNVVYYETDGTTVDYIATYKEDGLTVDYKTYYANDGVTKLYFTMS